MSYAMNLARYRVALNDCFSRGDAAGAKNFGILYFKTLREMAMLVKDPRHCQALRLEAERYELLTALVTKEGISQRAIVALQRIKEGQDPGITVKPAAPAKAKPKGGAGVTSPGLDPHRTSTVSADPLPVPPPLPPVPPGTEWVADIFERYLPATVTISCGCGSGTGFFISESGFILTNHHVACTQGGQPRATLQITSGDKKIECAATFIAADKRRDVALLRAELNGRRAPFIPLISDYSTLRQGMNMMLIGNAFSSGLAPITGTVKFLRDEQNGDMIYNAPSNNGDSGSPVLNRYGECIAIHKSRGTGDVGYANRQATPVQDIKKLLRKWKDENKF